MNSAKLELYAFYWSLARMLIAAISLFFGATPIAYRLIGFNSGVSSLLQLFWLISGVAALFLAYQWYKNGFAVFGGTDKKDQVALGIMIVTGLNLGLASGMSNIGIGIASSLPATSILFMATAVLYILVALYLLKQWKSNGRALFGSASQPAESPAPENAE